MDKRFHELLRGWLSGNFNRADEQEMQALGDADEFRRDAMEGYWSAAGEDHEKRLASLQSRLRERSGNQGAAVLRWPRMMSAAAILLLLLAAVYFVPRWMSDSDTAAVAAQQENDMADTVAAPPVASAPDDYADAGNFSGKSDRTTVSTAPDRSKLDDFAASGPPELAADREYYVAEEVKSEQLPPAADASGADEVTEKKEQVVSAPVVQSAPGSPVSTESAPLNATRDMAKKRADKDAGWHNTDTKPDMEAVRQKAKSAEPEAQSAPLDGWDEFSEYLRNNARLTPEARNNNISGMVKLQFTLDANAEPTQFQVLRSLGYGCDQEAIRLVQNYEWKRGKNPVITLEIKFVR